MTNKDIEKMFNFLYEAGKLKRTLRYGSDPSVLIQDSSADHSWRLALMTFILAEELNLKININKAIQLALIHDLPEALTGDIDATQIGKIITKEKKAENENKAMIKISNISSGKTKKILLDLWNEYEKCKSKEARFVKALDKIETLSHLLETKYSGEKYARFTYAYADQAVENFPKLKNLHKNIKSKLKKEFIKKNNW